MNREQQDYVWSILPKEAKEKMREIYLEVGIGRTAEDMLEDIFGFNNLTSDADVEGNHQHMIEQLRELARIPHPECENCEMKLLVLRNTFGGIPHVGCCAVGNYKGYHIERCSWIPEESTEFATDAIVKKVTADYEEEALKIELRLRGIKIV